MTVFHATDVLFVFLHEHCHCLIRVKAQFSLSCMNELAQAHVKILMCILVEQVSSGDVIFTWGHSHMLRTGMLVVNVENNFQDVPSSCFVGVA